MSSTRFDCLFSASKSGQMFANSGQFGGKIVLKKGWRHIASKWRNKSLFLCNIPYYTLLTAIIRQKENYVVPRKNRFVYCKPGVAELNLELSPSPFGLAS
jgi:nitrogen fixation protein